jgi:thiol-disulfide isomerase/thioredoxin
MKLLKLMSVCFLTLFGLTSYGQVNNKVENFTLLNLLDNSQTSLADFANYNCVVVIFVNNYCPYSKSYKTRIKSLIQKYGSNEASVKFLLINPEKEQDTEDDMKASAKEYGIPYLLDKGQVVTDKFQASKTPEAFVLQQNLGHFVIKYHGAIDDSPQLADDVKENYVGNAVEAVLQKKNPPITTQKPTGCMIKQ